MRTTKESRTRGIAHECLDRGIHPDRCESCKAEADLADAVELQTRLLEVVGRIRTKPFQRHGPGGANDAGRILSHIIAAEDWLAVQMMCSEMEAFLREPQPKPVWVSGVNPDGWIDDEPQGEVKHD